VATVVAAALWEVAVEAVVWLSLDQVVVAVLCRPGVLYGEATPPGDM
jgi:hypothetical protein